MRISDFIILAGGPGSGCHGPNCGRPSTLHQALNPQDDRARKVAEKAKALLRTRKIDQRLFQGKDKQMSSFLKAPTSARGKETVAWYAPHQRSLTLYPGGNHHDVVHEMGHLLDYAWLKKSAQVRESARIDGPKVKALMKDISKEYDQKRREKIGDKDPTKVWDKISNKGVPSAYGLYNKEEWLAESFHQYFKDNDRLKRVAPKTYNALKTILEGKIFK